MFAIVEITGKQYKVETGKFFDVEKLKDNKEGDKVKTDKVFLKNDGKLTMIGAPYVLGASVEFTVIGHDKADKIRVFKKKAKKRYERTQGHRQQYTRIQVTAIK